MFRPRLSGARLKGSETVADSLKSVVTGSRPAGSTDDRSAARAVREMFDQIAPRYDFLNHALSMNVDRLWWRRTARTFSHILGRGDARALDLCAGTGDMAVALRSAANKASGGAIASIYALDFS